MEYRCSLCGKKYPISTKEFRCSCGGFFELEVENIFSKEELEKRNHTIWRYREAYMLPDSLSTVTLGEGLTPLVKRHIQGADVYFKMDYMQPTGSFKDRGASVLISLIQHLGIKKVVEDSSGNAGAAVSAYSAAAGISCTVYVPSYTPEGKLSQISLYGSKVVKVPGKRQDANDAVIKAAQNAYYASHLWSPFFPIGLQSSAFEIWETFQGKIPDTIIVPVGAGGDLEGIYTGFKTLNKFGYAKKIPRIIGVQAEKCSPIYRAFEKGLNDYAEVKAEITVAEGIAVQEPPRAKAVLNAVRMSKGKIVAVTDNEILSALKKLISMGIYVEPTSASTLAAWEKLSPSEQDGAVLILTGSGLKETEKIVKLFLG
ncbi:MAG: threonine synthase [Spirochaetales bacterium]|nr:threonine synthase [Spirochaetales bacterium]